ncbi:GerA spore germination protein [Mesobacillus persicus]|uniref:GerA spore germination protein n=1 Tax=Mesobacillus persicus TaxID=930146 RepID=A0A1H8KU32_9BACI|nr:spore germination protein [Mesobacillus persicus]SEN96422.1 GerA spore germination protein [Mesobacillus persicus]
MSFFKKHKRKLPKMPKAENINKEESSPNAEKENNKLVKDWENELSKSNDYKKTFYFNQKSGKKFTFTYIPTLIEEKVLDNNALPNLLEDDFYQISDVKKLLPIADVEVSTNKDDIPIKLLQGYVLVTLEGDRSGFAFFSAQKAVVRSVSAPEIEFSVIGPKEAFVESIGQNMNLIRKRLPIEELIAEEFTVGKLSKTKVNVIYIDGITNEQIVNTVKQRINDIEKDEIADSSYFTQIISDNGHSPFPQLLDTERPDRVASSLAEGKVAILVDGSPHALLGPTTLPEFFNSFEDYYINWILASFIRLIRLFAVIFSIMITPIYVAIVTHHYELIPKDLLVTLVTSRRVVPFPPILEALFLEVAIELLREAGSRLPTKVGQTIGIVGGIVLGTASVEAGLTSNVLLIFVALSALASFTTPVYQMSNTIRILRFPFLFMAELWGLLGITIAFCFIITHLLRLTSLGQPFMEPVFPLRVNDFKDALIRLPFQNQAKRPIFLRTKDSTRFSSQKAHKKKDIDE